MRRASIEIRLDDPCTQDWASMSLVERGRFCASCQKTVIDMTSWTPQDIVGFFNENPSSICGRFRNDQLNRRLDDHADAPRRRRTSLKKSMAVVLSLLTLQTARAQEQGMPQIAQSPQAPINPDRSRIYGTITGASGQPIANALIEFGGESYRSDTLGKYEIDVPAGAAANGIIVFSHEDLRREVRSYNVRMPSLNYDVQLLKPSGRRYTMGAPIVRYFLSPDGSDSFVVVRGQVLDSAARQIIAGIAAKLQAYPIGRIKLQTYYGNDARKSIRQALLVQRYLSETCYIDEARILVPEPIRSKSAAQRNRVYFVPWETW